LSRKPIRNRSLVVVVSVVTAIALVITGCSSSKKNSVSSSSTAGGSSAAASGTSSPTGAPFKLGFICECTANVLGATVDASAVIKAWESYTNAHGGVNGHPVDVIVESEPANPGVALNDVKDLASKGIIALIDADPTDDTGFTSYALGLNIPIFSEPFSSPGMTVSPNSFATGVSENYLADEIILATKKAGATKLAMLYCAEVAVCAFEVDPMKAAAAKYGGVDVVYSASILAAAPNYTAQCLEAKNKGADAMFIADSAGPSLAAASSCAQQGYTPHQVSDEAAYSMAFAGKPGMDGFIGTTDNWPFFDTSIPAAKTFHDALQQYDPGALTNPIFGVGVELEWTIGMLFTEAAVKGKVGTTNPMTPAALFDGLYADSGTTLGGMTPPLTFIKGQGHEDHCWFWVGINNGKFNTSYGTQPACATAHPAAAPSS
jgi:branched-chain amino acid transport system substrate-binding protein